MNALVVAFSVLVAVNVAMFTVLVVLFGKQNRHMEILLNGVIARNPGEFRQLVKTTKATEATPVPHSQPQSGSLDAKFADEILEAVRGYSDGEPARPRMPAGFDGT